MAELHQLEADIQAYKAAASSTYQGYLLLLWLENQLGKGLKN